MMFTFQEKHKNQGLRESGFSLIEAMVAIVIFAIGILGVYTLQIRATKGNTLANRVSTSANWASYAIEEVLAKDFIDLPVGAPVGSGTLDDHLDRMNDISTGGILSDGIIYVQPDGSTIKKDESGAPGNPLYTVYYNILTGDAGGPSESKALALKDVKLIRTHVVRNGGVGDGHLYSHTYYKTLWPE